VQKVKTLHRQITVTTEVPVSTTHLDEFLKSKCAPDVLPFFQCNEPAKEVTESMAALRWAKKALREAGVESPAKRTDVICLVVGDGVLPRTGALVAHKTRWNVISVDPLLRIHDPRITGVKRLACIQARIEDVQGDMGWAEIGVILAVHSHAPLQAAWDKVRAKRKVCVAIPCCVEQKLEGIDGVVGSPMWEKRDPGILSDKNLVKVWGIG
jgi:hypothetical protein